MNLPLLEWLNKYTFPNEAKFRDVDYAQKVYEKVIRRDLCCGTTTCSWFASLHLESSKLLVDIVREQGQRAHIGKVSMDRNSPEDYIETTAQGLADVESFVQYVQDTDKTPQPLVTPSPPSLPYALSIYNAAFDYFLFRQSICSLYISYLDLFLLVQVR
mmetsp:Transcript_2266/g.2814  ORF Transcript_2266/g.2814 Transcript_2266/m.2814 type:complete len:159 (+) Transcript_2266:455-931(+)